MKTGSQVQGDVYSMLAGSGIATAISGSVYRNGMRPRDSRSEDAVVTFTAGLPDQIETGVVTVNIYVPDIDTYENGVLVKDGARCEELEAEAARWVETLTADKSGYRFRLNQTIYTEEDPEIHQHFIVVRLGYSYFE